MVLEAITPSKLNSLIALVISEITSIFSSGDNFIKIGFEKLIIKNNKMVGKFTSKQPKYFESPSFSGVLNFVQKHKKGVQLKEKKNQLSLVIDGVPNIEIVSQIINKILNL